MRKEHYWGAKEIVTRLGFKDAPARTAKDEARGALFPAPGSPMPLPASVLCQRVDAADLGARQGPG